MSDSPTPTLPQIADQLKAVSDWFNNAVALWRSLGPESYDEVSDADEILFYRNGDNNLDNALSLLGKCHAALVQHQESRE